MLLSQVNRLANLLRPTRPTFRKKKRSHNVHLETLESRLMLCCGGGGGPEITINDVTLDETNNTTKFTVSLSESSSETITVDYATADDTATAGSDYTSTSGTLTFDPSETSKEIDVPILSDSLDEINETFKVDLSNATNAQITDSQGIGTITDDDAEPSISVDDPSANESGTLTFTVSLSAASGKQVQVDYATSSGTASTPADYTALSTTTLTFNAGETSKTVDVTLYNDTTDEYDETLYLDLSNPSNATISDNQGTGTINDDDAPPTLTIDDPAEAEDSSPMVFTVTLSAVSGKTITLDYATADGTATTADSDYTAASGTITINAGSTSGTANVTLTNDTKKESDQTLKLNLSNPSNVTISDSQGLGTITDDDATGLTNTLDEFRGGGDAIHAGVLKRGYTLPSGLQLVYNTFSDARPIIAVETEQPDDSPVPDKIKAELTFNGSTGTAVYYSTTGLSAGDPLRFVLQADASSLGNGTYDWSLKLTEEHGSEISTRTFTGTRNVVNRTSSPFGSLWWVSGLDEVVEDAEGVTVFFGNGGSQRFDWNGSNYDPPSWSELSLVKNGDDSYTLSGKNGGKSEFNSSGQLTEHVDRNDNKVKYTYTAGLLSSIEDIYGRTTSFTYASDKLDKITDFDSRVTDATVDGSGNLTSLTAPDPDGGGPLAAPVTDYTYDATSGLMTRDQDPLDHNTDFDYDFADRLKKVTFHDTTTNEFKPVMVQGLVDLATSGSSGNPASLSAPADAVGSFKNGLAKETKYELDFLGGPTKITDPDNNDTTFDRDTKGRVTKITKPDPDGAGPLGTQVTEFLYDGNNDLTKITLPDSKTQLFEYDSTFHLVKKITNELGKIVLFDIDTNNGNVKSTTQVIGQIDDEINQETDDITTTFTYTADPASAGDLPGGMIKTITDPLSRVTEFTYETDDQQSDFGLLTSVKYAKNTSDELTVSYEYDAAGNRTAGVDGLSRRTEYTFDKLGRITKVKLPDPDDTGPLASPEIEYAYDAVGNLTKLTDALDNETSYTYDTVNQLTKITYEDPDDGGPLDAPEIEYEYDDAGQLTKFIDALDEETTYLYDNLGRNTKITLPDPDDAGPLAAPVWEYTYDLAGNVTKVKDPLSNETAYTYNIRDQLIKVTFEDPDDAGPLAAPEIEYEYDAAGNVTKFINPLDDETTFEFDDAGRQTKMVLPDLDGPGGNDPPEVVYEYDDAGNIVTVTNELGFDTDYTFDNLNRVTKITFPDPDGGGSEVSSEIEYEYDDASQVTKYIDAMDEQTVYTYDDLGRVTKITLPDPDGAGSEVSPEIEYSYDAAGNVLTETDPLDEVTDFTYDNLHRLTSRKLPDPDDGGSLGRPETTFEYDANGNLTKLTDPESNDTSWVYDDLNRVTTETNELTDSRTWEYDAANNVTKYTDREARVTEFTYDNLHRLTEEKWKDGETTVNTMTFVYDAASQLTSASDDASSYDYIYDELGRVEQVDIDNGGPEVQLKSTWDDAGNRTKLTAHIDFGSGFKDDFETTYTYDNMSRLTKIEQTDSIGTGSHSIADKRIDFEYNAASQFTTITRYDDLGGGSANEVAYTDFAYDNMGRLTDLTHTHDTTTIADYDYAFDASSRITQMDFTSSTGNDGISDYTYDDTNQLTDADHDYQTDEDYSYDENGNRTNTGYSTGSNNQLTSDGTFDYTYDDEGNRSTRTRISGAQADDKTTEYTWDHHNRLINIKYKNNSGTITKEIDYTYDVFDRRITKTIDWDGAGAGSADEVQYVYDGDHIVLAFDGNDDLTNRYLHGPVVDMILADEQVTSTTTDGDILWPLTDHLGSIRDIVDSDGNVDNHITYDAYGNITSETDNTVDHIFGFTGRDRDEESDLQYNRARFYSADVGRWISEDPIGFEAGDTNLNRYVSNQAVSRTDPTGLASHGDEYDTLNVAIQIRQEFGYAEGELTEDQQRIMDMCAGTPDPEKCRRDLAAFFEVVTHAAQNSNMGYGAGGPCVSFRNTCWNAWTAMRQKNPNLGKGLFRVSQSPTWSIRPPYMGDNYPAAADGHVAIQIDFLGPGGKTVERAYADSGLRGVLHGNLGAFEGSIDNYFFNVPGYYYPKGKGTWITGLFRRANPVVLGAGAALWFWMNNPIIPTGPIMPPNFRR